MLNKIPKSSFEIETKELCKDDIPTSKSFKEYIFGVEIQKTQRKVHLDGIVNPPNF